MKKDKRIKAYNKIYYYELKDAIRKLEPYLIKAFTQYYGEEYYEHIEYTIRNIDYAYFLSETYMRLLEQKSIGISNKDRRIAHIYIKYFNQLKNELLTLRIEERKNKVLASCFIASDKRMDDLDLFNNLSCDVSFYSAILNESEESYDMMIFLPIFTINLDMIIHEINHAFMVNIIAYSADELIAPNLFINEGCEEIINEYIAKRVLACYKSIHAPIPYFLRKFQFKNSCWNILYIVEPFCNAFSLLIKESIMKQNFNLLWEYVGKDNFYQYCSFVQKCYDHQTCSKEELILLNELTLKMKEHALAIKRVRKR